MDRQAAIKKLEKWIQQEDEELIGYAVDQGITECSRWTPVFSMPRLIVGEDVDTVTHQHEPCID
jgi:hypothetical protein